MNLVLRILGTALLLFGINVLHAQNVGVGTTKPKSRLHVAGTIQTDSTLVFKPIVKAAADAISIANTTGFLVITETSGTQLNVITMSGTPKDGQVLFITNGDNNKITFAGVQIPSGGMCQFNYFSGVWKFIGQPNQIRDADGDTKIQVEESADEDMVRIDISGVQRWLFESNRLAPTGGNSSLYLGQGAGTNKANASHNVGLGTSALSSSNGGDNNVGIGNNSLASNTSGNNNVGIGYYSLQSNVGGINNIAIGQEALRRATSSENIAIGYRSMSYGGSKDNIGLGERTLDAIESPDNIAIGRFSMYVASTATQNVGMGSFALYNTSTGDLNAAYGFKAQIENTTGSSNTAFGSNALFKNRIGNSNTAIGKDAGYNCTGSSNVFIGHKAGYNSNGASNKLYIDNSNTANPLIYGDFSTNLLRVNGTFNINNAYSLPTVDGTSGQTLVTDGSGVLSWASTSNTDNQTVDAFSLSGSTLSISLEDDGASNYTVDLSSINSDNQTVDAFSLSGSTLSLSLENDGASDYTVDLSAIDTDTDNQTVDKFSLSGATLSLSLEADGASDYTVNLSSIDTDTDDQTVDKFSLSGSTLSLSLEDDGTSDYTVNLSSIDTDTDDQTVDKFSLSGSTLSLSLEDDGASDYTVNLSSIDTDTDDQTVDKFSLSGATLSLSLEDDGASDYTVDLSSIDTDTDDQTVDKFSLSGTTLSLSLESDGQSDKTVDLSSINSTKSIIADADNDTKIQVEETADEDLVRMDIGGTERWVFNDRNLAPNFKGSVFIGNNTGASVSTGTNNTALGHQALMDVTTGSSNVAIGYRSLYNNEVGTLNVAVGKDAGFSTTGSKNVFLGHRAGYNETGSDKLYIDNSTTSTPLIYGDFSSNQLTVNGLFISDGNIRPKTSNTYNCGSSTYKWKAVYATNGTIQTSDVRFKKDITDMSYGLEELMALRSVTYQWKEDSLGETKLGFIAQELEQIVPEVVTVANDSMQTRGVNYSELIPVLVRAIQEQQALIEGYKLKIEQSEISNTELNMKQEARLASLEAKLNLLLNANTATK